MWRHSCVSGGGAHDNRVGGSFSPQDFCSVAGFWLIVWRKGGWECFWILNTITCREIIKL